MKRRTEYLNMDSWILIFLTISLLFALKTFLTSLKKQHTRIPPGPPAFPIIGNLVWLKRSIFEIEPVLQELRKTYGPIITLRIASRPAIFIADRGLAHEALVQKGAAFADRPAALPHDLLLSSNQHNISSAGYSSIWRLLRRNLSSELLHPSRLKLFAHDRKWIADVLLNSLRSQAESGDGVVVVLEDFHQAMFGLLVFMCFGERLDDEAINEIKELQRYLLLCFPRFSVFAFFPMITKVLFRNRWAELVSIRRKQEEIFQPMIRRRFDVREKHGEASGGYSYVDSLLGVRISEEGGRGLTDGEIVSLCSEFLAGGSDTTATALQWIMANLVKRQEIQSKLAEEIQGVVCNEVKEEDLQRMPYLKAVVLEGLRRHPPGHFVLPHAVTEEVVVGGYVIPKKASINFMVAEMNCDEKAWKEPREFRPERFMKGGEGEGVDITGSREIKMMTFGAGRRICPGLGLAMLHLEYFVANLVREFEWKEVEGEEVDMTESLKFTVVMKSPLQARIVARSRN